MTWIDRTIIMLHSAQADEEQQGGKNRRRGKNENDNEKRELVFKEDGQGQSICLRICQ